MNKCENCVKNDVCVHKANIKNDTYAYMGVNYDTENCPHYKDKSLFVEVVKCKDCIYYGGNTYGFVCKIFSGIDTKICMNSDDYCSYGERKLKEVGE